MNLHNHSADTSKLTSNSKKLARSTLLFTMPTVLKGVGSTFVSNLDNTPRDAELSHVYVSSNLPVVKKGEVPTFEDYIHCICIRNRDDRVMSLAVQDLDEMVDALIHVRGELKSLKEIYDARVKELPAEEDEDI